MARTPQMIRQATPPDWPAGRRDEDAIGDLISWDDALALYLAFCEASALAAKTLSIRFAELNLLRRFFGGSPAQISLAQLIAMQRRQLAPTSRQRNKTIYNTFFTWLHEEGYATINAARRLPKVREPRRMPRPLSVSQVERMLEASRNRKTRTFILLGAYQGMRVSEIARIRGEMFDLERNVVRWIGKGGHQREMGIHPVVRAELGHYPAHGYWFPSPVNARKGIPHVNGASVGQSIHLAMRRAGIDEPSLTAHSLRHFFGTELVAAGVDIRTVQELMGHQQLNSTQLYTRVSSDLLRAGLASLPEVTLPGAHFSRRHRRTWLTLRDAAAELGVSVDAAARLAQEHAWRYTADGENLVYAISDVEAEVEQRRGA